MIDSGGYARLECSTMNVPVVWGEWSHVWLSIRTGIEQARRGDGVVLTDADLAERLPDQPDGQWLAFTCVHCGQYVPKGIAHGCPTSFPDIGQA